MVGFFLGGFLWSVIGFFLASVSLVQIAASLRVSYPFIHTLHEKGIIAEETRVRLQGHTRTTIMINAIIHLAVVYASLQFRHPITLVLGFAVGLSVIPWREVSTDEDNYRDWFRVNLGRLDAVERMRLHQWLGHDDAHGDERD